MWFPTGLLRSRTLENYQPPTGTPRALVLEEADYDRAGRMVQGRRGTGKQVVVSDYDAAGRLYKTTLDPVSAPGTAVFRNPGAYLGTTTTGGVADNPVRVEAETATATGVVINSTPAAHVE